VIPLLVAVTTYVIGDAQMALLATFGGFATLVIASFGGTRRDVFLAHAGLAVAGSLALIIGTLASSRTWLAAVVTLLVVFAVLFAGIVGPNAARGATAVLFAYVLPVASAGGAATIPSRLEGWWLASAAGTIAVLLLFPPAAGSQLRNAAAGLAAELASRIRAASDGQVTSPDAMRAATRRLRTAFTAAPYRPTGLAAADQALASVVQLLDWAGTQADDALDGHLDVMRVCPADRALLRACGDVLADIAALLTGQNASPDLAALETARARAAASLRELAAVPAVPAPRAESVTAPDQSVPPLKQPVPGLEQPAPPPEEPVPPLEERAAQSVHAQAIAVAARTAAPEAAVAAGRTRAGRTPGTLVTEAVALVRRNATIRSVWFASSLRGAIALAAAVAVADASGVQHGFWVVLGTLSVLRTNATGTGATALRALSGTVVGFIVGALLLVGIGTGPTALWVAFPLAVLVAAYAPGTMPFLAGQAAFTITIVVLFNLLAPAGWAIGLLRVEDVAIGCAVSLVVGVLCWPRGASGIVGDDLADAFRSGAAFLSQAVEWALSELMSPPAAGPVAVAAGLRLDDAMRGFLAEQGSKRARKEDLWTLVTASVRLRLTADTLTGLRPAELSGTGGPACLPLPGSQSYAGTPACTTLRSAAADLAGYFGQVADEVGRPRGDVAAPAPLAPPAPAGTPVRHPHLLWIAEHLRHLNQSAEAVSGPAQRLAEIRRRPWWR
jgi:uncharacterized membrane protein YccC